MEIFGRSQQTFYHPGISFGLNPIFIGHEKCIPSHTFGPAVRSHYLFHFIIEGKGTLKILDQVYHIKAGEGFVIFPGELAWYSADAMEPWEYVWIAFDGPDAVGILKKCGLHNKNHHFINCPASLLTEQFLYMFESADGDEDSVYRHLSDLYALFDLMKKSSPRVSDRRQSYVNTVKEFIHNNFVYDIKISDVANAVGLDRTYLYRLFKEATGDSIQGYLIKYRLKASMDLLKTTDLSITEIAISSGFKSCSAYSKHFTHYFNQSPLKYKAEIK